jgi:hypothetical protein
VGFNFNLCVNQGAVVGVGPLLDTWEDYVPFQKVLARTILS